MHSPEKELTEVHPNRVVEGTRWGARSKDVASGIFPEEISSTALHYDRYIPVVKLGTGGMAEIYLGAQFGEHDFERLVVIKRVHPHRIQNPLTYEMFVQEARIVSALDHPNIVKIYEFSKVENEIGLVMEYVDGESLSYLVKTMKNIGSDIPLPVILSLMVQACEAIGYAHEVKTHDGSDLKLIHRDLDARNLMLDGRGYLKIIDFGIAKSSLRNDLTVTRQIKGKVDYLCPDLIHFKEVDGRVDVYSLGLVLFYLLTKEKPLLAPKGTPFWQMIEMMQVNNLPRPSEINPRLPEDMDYIVAKATEKDRENRYQSGDEFAAAMRQFAKKHCELASPGEVKTWLHSQFPNRLNKRRKLEYKVLKKAKAVYLERLQEATNIAIESQEPSRIAEVDSKMLIHVEDELKSENETKISPWPGVKGDNSGVVFEKRQKSGVNPYFLVSLFFVFSVTLVLLVHQLFWLPYIESQKTNDADALGAIENNLFVDSLPANADVFVDGKKVGSTGTVGLTTTITPGKYQKIVVRKEGFEPYEILVRGETLGQRRLEAQLKPVDGETPEEMVDAKKEEGPESKLKALFDIAVGDDAADNQTGLLLEPGPEAEMDEDPEKDNASGEFQGDVDVEAPDVDNQSKSLKTANPPPGGSELKAGILGNYENPKRRVKRRKPLRAKRETQGGKSDDEASGLEPAEIADNVYD